MVAQSKLKTIEATIPAAIEAFQSGIQDLHDEMESWADNMESNNMEHLPKFEQVTECRDALEQVLNDTMPDVSSAVIKDLLEVKVSYFEHPGKGKKGPSRATRRDNAVAALEAVIEHVTAWEDGLPKGQVLPSEAEDLRSVLGDLKDGAEAIDFPGMF